MGIRDGTTDGDAGFAFDKALDGRPDRGLGGAIEVPDLGSGIDEGVGQAARDRFATREEAESALAFPAAIEQHLPGRGSGLHHGDVLGLEEFGEAASVFHILGGGDNDGRTGKERQEHLEERDVEGKGRHGEESILGGESGLGLHRAQEVHGGAVRDLDALRFSGGTRGVDDVGERIAGEALQFGRLRGAFDLVEIDHAPGSAGQGRDEATGGDERLGRGVLEHEFET